MHLKRSFIQPASTRRRRAQSFFRMTSPRMCLSGQVGHEALQTRVLVAQLAQFADLGDRRFRSRRASAHCGKIRHRRAALACATRSDLLVAELRLLSVLIPVVEDPRSQFSPVLNAVEKRDEAIADATR